MSSPNILFLLSDEHSFRFMGHVPRPGGGEPVKTPVLDELANCGTRFSDAYCQVALCTPSRFSILTGLEPRKCGAWWNEDVLRPELETFPGVLSAAGYSTCLVGKMHLGGTNQYAGFQKRPYGDLTGKTGHQWEPLDSSLTGPYAMRFRTKDAGVTEIPESQMQERIVAEEGLSFLREQRSENPDSPWLLCLSFSRPHFPLTAPRRHFRQYWPDNVTEPFVPAAGDAYDHPMSRGMREGFRVDEITRREMMKARAGYFSSVTYLDEIIGDLFSRLEADGFMENTVVVYTSDHGEMAGEHGVWWKHGWHEAATRVPLLISLPEQRRPGGSGGSVVHTPVALMDLAPTLCCLAGVPKPRDFAGEDLSSVVRGETSAPDRPITTDNLLPRWGEGTEFRMVRWGQYKYVRFRSAPDLFFDLEEDPGEQHNLLSPDGVKALSKEQFKLIDFAKQSMDFEQAERERIERDGQLRETYKLDVPESTPNLYVMPSGKVVDADTVLYDPNVIMHQPDQILTGKPVAKQESTKPILSKERLAEENGNHHE